MHIDKSLVEHLANLSCLHFTEDEMVSMQSDLEKMIGFVEKLNELDTTGVEPLRHMSSVQDIFREDLPSGKMDVADALKNAEKHTNQFFTVPKVLG